MGVQRFTIIPFLLLWSGGAVAAPSCADLSLPSFPVCELTRSGVIFAASADEARAAAAAANQGAESFARHVGPVIPYAVVIGSDVGPAQSALRKAGYRVVLPWLNPAARREGLEASVRRSTEAQLRAKGFSQDRIDAAVAQALAQVGGNTGGRLLASYSAVAHELGHLWLMQAFWGGARAAPGAGAHYGGPGPDWLDETVAVAMEDEMLTAPRRARFRELWKGAVSGRVESLTAFFSMDHPLKAVGSLVRSGAVGSGGSGVTVLTGEEVQGKLGIAADAAPNFYAQARAVADFLIERSGNPRILGVIARHLSAKGTMAGWLAKNGRRYRLGATLRELEREWRKWAAAKYG